jgi:hypothetical protein
MRPHLFFEDLAGYCVGNLAYCITLRLIKPFIDGKLGAIDTDDKDEANDRREFNVKLSLLESSNRAFLFCQTLPPPLAIIDTNERVLHCS